MYQNNAQRRIEVEDRLEKAAKVPATARLMESPLQVTIMARLLAQIAQPPQERYRLFQDYYEVIYRREMEREIEPLSQILREHKADVDSIHHRMGLLLQIESEQSQHADATMSQVEFEQVVRGRLVDEGHEGQGLEYLIDCIASSATNRLVFLVPLQSGQVGFEIRSLQEFMAAEALMDTSDVMSIERLKQISSIPFWRNVFLFSAGKIFAERQWLRDNVASMCAGLNDDPADTFSHYVRIGSRLSANLLEDGPTRKQPVYAQMLARNALSLLSVFGDDSLENLAEVYESSLRSVYEEEITLRLQSERRMDHMNAWVLLILLVGRGESWAQELAEKNWPSDSDDQIRIIRNAMDIGMNGWLGTKLSNTFFKFSMQETAYPFYKDFSSFLDKNVSRIYKSLHDAGLGKSISLDKLLPGAIMHFGPLSGDQAKVLSVLKDLHGLDVDPSWKPLIESAVFLENPTHLTLAKALRNLMCDQCWDSALVRPTLPWPIAACLYKSQESKLGLLASKAERGELGTIENWIAAEERWAENGITVDDIQYMKDDTWPIPPEIAIVGFPFAGASIGYRMDIDNTSFMSSLLEITQMISSVELKQIFGGMVRYVQLEVGYPQNALIPRDLLVLLHQHGGADDFSFLSGSFLHAVIGIAQEDTEVRELLELIGNNLKGILSSFRVGRDNVGGRLLESFQMLCPMLNNGGYTSSAISNILLKIATKAKVPHMGAIIRSYVDSPFSIALSLTNTNLTGHEARQYALDLLKLKDAHFPIIMDALACFEKYQMENYSAFSFLEELYTNLVDSEDDQVEKIVRLMLSSINKRKSKLDQLDVWTRLQLPVALHPILSRSERHTVVPYMECS
jgi:hypothetical protein